MRLSLPIPSLLVVALASCSSTTEAVAPQPTLRSTEPASAPPVETVRVVEAAPAPVPQDDVQESRDEVVLRQQTRKALAADFVAQGEAELDRADLSAALASFASAMDVDPSNQEARERLRHVQALMGDSYASAADAFADETERAVVRRAQARLEADANTIEGDRALADADYDTAIDAYRQAEIILSYHPYIATDSLDERIVKGKLQEAIRLRDEARLEDERMAREAAEAERRAAEEAERDRREGRIRSFFANANEDFLAERYASAEQWCTQILLEDPSNEEAVLLKETAREARHFQTNERHRRDYREQWLRTMEELGTMDVPQTEALVFDDLDRWAEVLERQPLERAQMNEISLAERAEVIATLESVQTPAPFAGPDGEGSELSDVAAYLQRVTGVNFWISPTVIDELDEDETTIAFDLPRRSVKKILDLISETRESLRWKVEDGVVKFVTIEEMVGGQILKTYSVQDLIHPIRDYPGGDINVDPSGGIIPPDEDFDEREANVITSTLLEDLIINNVAPESWENDPNNSAGITETGTLVVNQTPDVHQMIEDLLADLREATGIMVDIQSRFMKVEDNFLEDIGVDFRGLGQPGPGTNGTGFNDFGDASTQSDLGSGVGQGTDLGAFYDDGEDGDIRARVEALYDTSLGDDSVLQASGGLSFQWAYLNDLELELILRAVSKSERVELVTAPRITVHNTARANLSVLNQVAYVQDFDVEIAQAASIADPIIAVIQDGVILDVRPVVSADRRFITLELRPTIAQLKRPIEEKQTTLGSQATVTIQLPEVEIQRVRTSIPMPDGGTVLLGGMKISEKKDLRSGVPILNKIPILSALFERKGNMVSNRKLLILLRANIVIPDEVEPTASEVGLAK